MVVDKTAVEHACVSSGAPVLRSGAAFCGSRDPRLSHSERGGSAGVAHALCQKTQRGNGGPCVSGSCLRTCAGVW